MNPVKGLFSVKQTGLTENSISSEYSPVRYWNILSSRQRRKSMEVVLYDNYNDIIGVGRSLYISRKKCDLSDLWIIPEYRARGCVYDTKMLSNILIETLIGVSNKKRIYVEVSKENEYAMEWFGNYGFKKVKKTKKRREFLKPLNFKKTVTMILKN